MQWCVRKEKNSKERHEKDHYENGFSDALSVGMHLKLIKAAAKKSDAGSQYVGDGWAGPGTSNPHPHPTLGRLPEGLHPPHPPPKKH